MKYLMTLVFICLTSVALATYIYHDPIFVYNSDKKLTDAELKKLADDYYIEREKNRQIVTVTYKKETMKGGVVYHYTVKNDGWDEVTGISIGNDNYAPAIDYPTSPPRSSKYEGTSCEIPPENVIKVKSSNNDWNTFLQQEEENDYSCLEVTRKDYSKLILQNHSITISVYLSKDEPKFAKLHWVASFSGSDSLPGLVKKAP
jgi:hypothetical protein